MCQVIVTCRSLIWTLITILTTLMLVVSVCSPYWLTGKPQHTGLSGKNYTILKNQETFHPTVGIFNRCYRLHKYNRIYHRDSCDTYVTKFHMSNENFPNTWKAALFFFVCGVLAMIFTTATSVISLCTRALCSKSIFTLSGLIQSIAGLFCIIGLILYPAGWGTERVKKICGDLASPYNIDNCSLGWALYLNIVSICFIFICSTLSIQANHSMNRQKVQEDILTGKSLICIA
ncbi:LHFPL tetraspan subfamily member 2a protein [Octopus bimaculoides]|uniref:Lipoma HMGIC fusion partner-like 2 protein n=1 Tax=Octopus bimaculoides TaxID=37653 RepID=A0A0L8HX01_OCTBM|nr:LHFPL tetraspan subfamily member 2a protein [Octopus bimaculoides]|eukprot:XP_014768693.1 PREDICTED: lipoma HMGIC fusion partner-like 2 protein [Octopus bimaculoides]